MALKCQCGQRLYTEAGARAHTCRYRTPAVAARMNQRIYGGSGTTGPTFDTPMIGTDTTSYTPPASDSGGYSGGGAIRVVAAQVATTSMKEKELRAHANCGLCSKPIGHTGLPLFWRITVERFGLNAGALRRQQGLGMMVGATLAQVMGPDEDMATPMMEKVVISVCEDCACSTKTPIAAIAELATPVVL